MQNRDKILEIWASLELILNVFPSGVDGAAFITLHYSGGRVAQLNIHAGAWLSNNMLISGTTGTMEVNTCCFMNLLPCAKRSCGKVMFLHLSDSVHRGEVYAPSGQTPPSPLRQTPLLGRVLQRAVYILLKFILVIWVEGLVWK